LLVLPCDQYRIAPNDLRTLRDTWRLAPTVACVSRWGEYAGPPAILPVAYHEQALSLRGDTGARALLYGPRRPRPAEVVNPRAPHDLDSPRDLVLAQALSATYAGSAWREAKQIRDRSRNIGNRGRATARHRSPIGLR
jgi:CTP:molybdopterin cytidylyltransferase MocA